MSNQQKWWGVVVVVVLAVAVLWWATRSQPEASVDSEKVTVGAILPLTGNLSKVGTDVRAALEIAQADWVGRGLDIEIVYEDDAFVPERSVTAFTKLVDQDGVSFIIGPLNGSSIEAVRPLASEKHVVAFTPWGAGNKIGDFTIKNSVEADEEARVIAQKAIQDLGLTRLAIMYLQNDWGQAHVEAFTDEVGKLGGEMVVAEPFVLATADFRTILTKVKSANVDGLYIVHNGALVGQITKQATELGLATQFFGQYATESSDLIDVGGNSLEGLIYTFPIDEGNLTDRQREFVTRFEQKVGGKPQVAAYNAYDIYSILVDALGKCSAHDGMCFRDSILGLSNFEGVGGVTSFTGGRLERNFFFKTIRNGQFVSL